MNRVLLALLVCGFVLTGRGHAADFFVERRIENPGYNDTGVREPRIIIGMRGEIVEGDAERLSALMLELSGGERSLRYLQGLSLDSPGGSLDAAIALAESIWELSMTTFVPAGKRCLSGCAIAFMAGRQPETDEFSIPRRFIHPTARLGFHAPFALADTSEIAPDVAKILLRDAERGGSLAASKLVKLAVDQVLSSSLVEALLQYDKDNFLYIDSVDEAGRWQIGLIDEASFVPPGDILQQDDVARLEMHCNNRLYWLQDVAAENRRGTSKFNQGTLIFDGLDHSCEYTSGSDGGFAYNIDSKRGGTVLHWQTFPPETKLALLSPEQPNDAGVIQDPFSNPPPRKTMGPCQDGYQWVGGWGGPDYRNSKAFAALRECNGTADIFRMECKHGEQVVSALLLTAPFTPHVTENSKVELQIDNGLRVTLAGTMQIAPGVQPYFTFQVPREDWTLRDAAEGTKATFWVDNRSGSMHLAGTAQAIGAMQDACL